MTSISPFLRGYRLALRDIQHATERFTKAQKVSETPVLALFMAADRVAWELSGNRSSNREVMRNIQEAEEEFWSFARDAKDPQLWLPRVVFARGYRAGFDRGLQLMTEHAWKMKDPAARFGILRLVMRLETIRFEIASDEDGKIRTLRARKFGGSGQRL